MQTKQQRLNSEKYNIVESHFPNRYKGWKTWSSNKYVKETPH